MEESSGVSFLCENEFGKDNIEKSIDNEDINLLVSDLSDYDGGYSDSEYFLGMLSVMNPNKKKESNVIINYNVLLEKFKRLASSFQVRAFFK